jgi:hypothetical protein
VDLKESILPQVMNVQRYGVHSHKRARNVQMSLMELLLLNRTYRMGGDRGLVWVQDAMGDSHNANSMVSSHFLASNDLLILFSRIPPFGFIQKHYFRWKTERIWRWQRSIRRTLDLIWMKDNAFSNEFCLFLQIIPVHKNGRIFVTFFSGEQLACSQSIRRIFI